MALISPNLTCVCRLYEGEETVVARFEILLEEWLMTISDGLEHRVSLEDRGIRLELILRWIRSPFEVSVAFFKLMSVPV